MDDDGQNVPRDVGKVSEPEISSACSKHLEDNRNRLTQFYVQVIDYQKEHDHVEVIIVEEIVAIEDGISLNGVSENGQSARKLAVKG